MRALPFVLGTAVVLSSCQESDEVPLATDSGVGEQISALEQSTLDVLFVIDDSGSMASQQAKLAVQIPRMIAVLTSGDRYATREKDVPADLSEDKRRFTAVSSLHVGIVTTTLGGIPDDGLPRGAPAALLACTGRGDDGLLQNSLDVATRGVTAEYNNEFPNATKGQVVIPADPSCALGPQPLYQTFDASSDPAAVAKAFSCEARVGVRGCPFEQPLESMWAALAPSTGKGELFTFLDDTRGRGNQANAGFLRPHAALAVVVLSDEEDCSVTPAASDLNSYSDDAAATYGDLNAINMRCYLASGDPKLLHAVTRYRDGLLSLKPGHEDRTVFTIVAGLPRDASTRSFDSLLADPAMTVTVDPLHEGFPAPVCTGASQAEPAYPARRLLETAKLMPNALAESICADDFAPVIDAMVNKIAPMMAAP